MTIDADVEIVSYVLYSSALMALSPPVPRRRSPPAEKTLPGAALMTMASTSSANASPSSVTNCGVMGLRRSGSWRMRCLISGTLSMLRMALVPARQAQRVFREVGEHKFLGDRRDTEQAGLSEVALHVVLLRVPEAPQGLHGAICCEESGLGTAVLGLVGFRSEERRGERECVSRCKSRW